MKYVPFLLLILSLVLINEQPAMSQACTDPGGCSAVSYAAFQHTVGVVRFGNTTGRVVSKKKATLCPEANCNSFFTMSTALVAPRTTAGVSKAAPAASVTVISVRRALTTAQTGIFRNTLDLLATTFRQVPQRTKFSSFPFSMGFGNNAIAFLNPVGTRQKIVSNVFNSTANTLSRPIAEVLPFSNFVGASISRDGKLVAWANRKDLNTVSLNFRQLNSANRKPTGPPEVIARNLPISPDGDIQTISSLAVSDPIRPPRPGSTVDGPRIVVQKLNLRNVTASTADVDAKRSEEKIRLEGGVHRSSEEVEEEEEIGAGTTLREGPNAFGPAAFERSGPILPPTRTGLGTSDFFQSVAVDPQGRYALYTVFSQQCKKWILKYQRINTFTRKKIGGPKVLAGCSDVSSPANSGIYGLNVINLE